ncbi:hypothetical protein PM082_015443 [Marasmius tenuissimus]|nr:hypothetical protein PM082_015443 [Marasmius tenuissimus]
MHFTLAQKIQPSAPWFPACNRRVNGTTALNENPNSLTNWTNKFDHLTREEQRMEQWLLSNPPADIYIINRLSFKSIVAVRPLVELKCDIPILVATGGSLHLAIQVVPTETFSLYPRTHYWQPGSLLPLLRQPLQQNNNLCPNPAHHHSNNLVSVSVSVSISAP